MEPHVGRRKNIARGNLVFLREMSHSSGSLWGHFTGETAAKSVMGQDEQDHWAEHTSGFCLNRNLASGPQTWIWDPFSYLFLLIMCPRWVTLLFFIVTCLFNCPSEFRHREELARTTKVPTLWQLKQQLSWHTEEQRDQSQDGAVFPGW